MSNITRRTIVKTATCGAVTAPFALMMARPAMAASHTVTIKGFKFSPADLTVSVGDTVRFVNEDGAPHTATAKGGFDTGRLNKGDSREITINTAGKQAYACQFHSNMKGSITAE